MIKKFIDPFEIAFIKEIIGMDIRIDDKQFLKSFTHIEKILRIAQRNDGIIFGMDE